MECLVLDREYGDKGPGRRRNDGFMNDRITITENAGGCGARQLEMTD